MPIPPPSVLITIGAAAVVLIGRLVVREWRRVNAELDRQRDEPISDGKATRRQTLKRDPKEGVWRA